MGGALVDALADALDRVEINRVRELRTARLPNTVNRVIDSCYGTEMSYPGLTSLRSKHHGI